MTRQDGGWLCRQHLVHGGLMEIRHLEGSPSIDPEAYVAPTAVLSGRVRVGVGSCVLHSLRRYASFLSRSHNGDEPIR